VRAPDLARTLREIALHHFVAGIDHNRRRGALADFHHLHNARRVFAVGHRPEALVTRNGAVQSVLPGFESIQRPAIE